MHSLRSSFGDRDTAMLMKQVYVQLVRSVCRHFSSCHRGNLTDRAGAAVAGTPSAARFAARGARRRSVPAPAAEMTPPRLHAAADAAAMRVSPQHDPGGGLERDKYSDKLRQQTTAKSDAERNSSESAAHADRPKQASAAAEPL